MADPGPLGARVGLVAGDIIVSVDRDALNAPSDLGPLLRQAGRRVTLTVQRGRGQVFLSFRV